jgi:hypothetical protein
MYLGLKARVAVFILLVPLCVAAATDYVDFTIFDRIKFSVPGNWKVLASKSSADKTVFAFQIPNAADEGTTDSSNLSIISSFLRDAQDREAFEKKARYREPNAKQRKFVEGWLCSSFSSMQRSTEYVVWDCSRAVGDCGVAVRVAWPHLVKNPVDYDIRMEAVLSDFLTSVGPSNKPAK